MLERLKAVSPVTLDSHTCEKLLRFSELILEYKSAARLTSLKSKDDILDILILESIQLAKLLLPTETRTASNQKAYPMPGAETVSRSSARFSLADIGAGSGAVGLSLAAIFPQAEFHLFERSQRKVGFLRIAVSELSLGNATVHNRDVLEIRDGEFAFDFAAARGFAKLDAYLQIAKKLLKPSGYILGFSREEPASILKRVSFEKSFQLSRELAYELPGGRKGYVYSVSLGGSGKLGTHRKQEPGKIVRQ